MGKLNSRPMVYSSKKYTGKSIEELTAEHVENMNGAVRVLVSKGRATCALGRRLLEEKAVNRIR